MKKSHEYGDDDSTYCKALVRNILSQQRANISLHSPPTHSRDIAPRRVDLRRNGTVRLRAVIWFSRFPSTHSHDYSFFLKTIAYINRLTNRKCWCEALFLSVYRAFSALPSCLSTSAARTARAH